MTTVKTNPIFTKNKNKNSGLKLNWFDEALRCHYKTRVGWGGGDFWPPHLINTESKTFVFNRVENRWLKSPKLKIHKTYSPTKLWYFTIYQIILSTLCLGPFHYERVHSRQDRTVSSLDKGYLSEKALHWFVQNFPFREKKPKISPAKHRLPLFERK